MYYILFVMVWSVIVLVVFYLVIVGWLVFWCVSFGLLYEVMFVLGVIFIMLVILFVFDGCIISVVWVLEGVVVVWLGVC